MKRRAWLSQVPWDLVVFQNASLCETKQALHKPTSDGYDATRTLWEQMCQIPMTLVEDIELCRRCHKMAPFCFYNGNTFAAIARNLVNKLGLDSPRAAAARSMAGHIVAGVATDEEIASFRKLTEAFDAG
jgi:hypothetical protein